LIAWVHARVMLPFSHRALVPCPPLDSDWADGPCGPTQLPVRMAGWGARTTAPSMRLTHLGGLSARVRAMHLAARGPVSGGSLLAPRALQHRGTRRSMYTVEAKVRAAPRVRSTVSGHHRSLRGLGLCAESLVDSHARWWAVRWAVRGRCTHRQRRRDALGA
jgi:hypothetical protein